MADSAASIPPAGRVAHLRLMARYNAWMNERLYAAAAKLPADEIAANRGAFFGSILGTLNHVMVGDTIWLKRFAEHPAAWPALDPVRALPMPASLDAVLHGEFAPLEAARKRLDATIEAWAATVEEPQLDALLAYRTTKGVPCRRRFFSLAMHFFNHQAHHRGQATTLLSQAGVDPGVTDLLVLIPDED